MVEEGRATRLLQSHDCSLVSPPWAIVVRAAALAIPLAWLRVHLVTHTVALLHFQAARTVPESREPLLKQNLEMSAMGHAKNTVGNLPRMRAPLSTL